ncbi:MAG: MBL fold metallo-hydrolase [Candidatus Micrarchaeaceae archaeon]
MEYNPKRVQIEFNSRIVGEIEPREAEQLVDKIIMTPRLVKDGLIITLQPETDLSAFSPLISERIKRIMDNVQDCKSMKEDQVELMLAGGLVEYPKEMKELINKLQGEGRVLVVRKNGVNFYVSKKYREISLLDDLYGELMLPRDARQEEIDSAVEIHRGSKRYDTLAMMKDPEFRKKYDQAIKDVEPVFYEQLKLPVFRFLALGGASHIGGSSYYLRVGKHRVLLDCGAEMKRGEIELPRLDILEKMPRELLPEAVFITHAHNDHMSVHAMLNLKKILPDIKFYATAKTKEIFETTLIDKKVIEDPLLAKPVLESIEICDMGKDYDLNGLRFRFENAGHIPGSAMVFLADGDDTVLYTGDMNMESYEGHIPAKPVNEHVGTLIIEGTYVKEERRSDRDEREDELREKVADALKSGKSVIIPAFTIDRASTVMQLIENERDRGRIPKDVPLLCGGMGFKLAMIETKLKYFNEAPSTEQVKEMMKRGDQFLIVAGAGMSNGGFVATILPDAMNNPNVTYIQVGYQAPGTNGEKLASFNEGNPIIINGEEVPLAMDIDSVQLGAHASRQMLLDFIRQQDPDYIIMVHTNNVAKAKKFLKQNLKKPFEVPATSTIVYDFLGSGLTLFGTSHHPIVFYECKECGGKFTSEYKAKLHASITGHSNIEANLKWYKFSIYGTAEIRELMGAIKSVLKRKTTFLPMPEHPDKFFIQDNLTEEEIKLIEKIRIDGARIKYKGLGDVLLPAELSDNIEFVIGKVLDKLTKVSGKKFTSPKVTVNSLPPGIMGLHMWNAEKKKGRVIISNSGDSYDMELVLAHELSHQMQYYFNEKISNKTDKKFIEGFANYMTVVAGYNKRLITELHEPESNREYEEGRKMFEAIELTFGRTKAIDIALTGNESEFYQTYSYALKIAYENALKMAKKLKLWRRYYLFFRGFPPSLRKSISSYVVSHLNELEAEYEGWKHSDVIESVIFYGMADFAKPIAGDLSRESLALMFREIYKNKYTDDLSKLEEQIRGIDKNNINKP